jgi:uncharacterized repeat protein (TIGR01451 family)
MVRRAVLIASMAAAAALNPAPTAAYTPRPPVLAMSFSQSSVHVGGDVTLSFTVTNPAENVGPLTNISFGDVLPGNLRVLASSRSVCHGGTLTTIKPSVISLAGGSLDPGLSCSFNVTVTAMGPGTMTNAVGGVSSNEASSTTIVVASLNAWLPPTVVISWVPTTINVGETAVLSIYFKNDPANTIALGGIATTISAPSALEVATSSWACGASTVHGTSPGTWRVYNVEVAVGGTCTNPLTFRATAAGTHRVQSVAEVDGWTFDYNTSYADLTVIDPHAPAAATPTPTAAPAASSSASAGVDPSASDASFAPSPGDSPAATASTSPAVTGVTGAGSGNPPIAVLAAAGGGLILALLALVVLLRRRRRHPAEVPVVPEPTAAPLD